MIKFGSGSYSVRESEGLNPQTLTSPSFRTITCTVFFLDDTERNFEIDRYAKGQILLDKVFEHLELVEKDYFGLQFLSFIESSQTGIKKWLDPAKSVRKQMFCPPFRLYFRVKFYISDPSRLTEEYTRYHIFLQLRRDLLEDRLVCTENMAALLSSYAVQSEFGDYNEEELGNNYLDDYPMISAPSATFLKNVMELHKLHKGQTPAEAEFNFLENAKTVDTYGVDLYVAKESNGQSVEVGVSSAGVMVFRSGQRESLYPWSAIMKISFKKKLFSLYMRVINEQNVSFCCYSNGNEV
ncbi:unnamed protein product [Enterobius vermicularis]|uniref:Moesin/ezrin/radixin homolog 1 n=1 Tax=Enterobius vermicularis TaxID=51028 RepID=A0A0N4VD95_ENTVE|nr:unnamed protein product [Enterobius vermicularis]